MLHNPFYEVALLLVAIGLSAVAVRFRQPLIVAFIAVGVLVGPSSAGDHPPGRTLGPPGGAEDRAAAFCRRA